MRCRFLLPVIPNGTSTLKANGSGAIPWPLRNVGTAPYPRKLLYLIMEFLVSGPSYQYKASVINNPGWPEILLISLFSNNKLLAM